MCSLPTGNGSILHVYHQAAPCCSGAEATWAPVVFKATAQGVRDPRGNLPPLGETLEVCAECMSIFRMYMNVLTIMICIVRLYV